MCICERGKFAEAIPRVRTEASVSHGPRFPGCDNLSCHIGWVGRHLETSCTPSSLLGAQWGGGSRHCCPVGEQLRKEDLLREAGGPGGTPEVKGECQGVKLLLLSLLLPPLLPNCLEGSGFVPRPFLPCYSHRPRISKAKGPLLKPMEP